ncbi:hypothetical protein LXL04_037472 [Taraxacum kok-saghyz]
MSAKLDGDENCVRSHVVIGFDGDRLGWLCKCQRKKPVLWWIFGYVESNQGGSLVEGLVKQLPSAREHDKTYEFSRSNKTSHQKTKMPFMEEKQRAEIRTRETKAQEFVPKWFERTDQIAPTPWRDCLFVIINYYIHDNFDESLYFSGVLNGIKHSGMSRHKLVVKFGFHVMLLRNIDQKCALSNRVIKVEIISGSNIGNCMII